MSGSPEELTWAERSRGMKQLTQGHTGQRWGRQGGWAGGGGLLLSLILKLLLGLERGCRTDEPCGRVCRGWGHPLVSFPSLE